MPLVVACLLVLTVGAFAAMQFGVLTGGSQAVRNYVDAGALNVAARATDVQVEPTNSYSDVSTTSGKISLTNINRVLGKALLINANAADMKSNGQQGNLSQTNAQAAMAEANNISQQLVAALTDGQFLKTAFSQVGWEGGGGSPQPGGGKKSASHFGSSFVHAGQTSNVTAQQGQFPLNSGVRLNGPIPGYQAVNVNDQQFFLVPFKQGEKPHLISLDEFNAGVNPPHNWTAPVPNAFSAQGQLGSEPGVQSTSGAVSNPQQQYTLAIPHAFVEIQLQPTSTQWQVNGKQAGDNTTYKFTPVTQYGVQNKKVGCKSQLNGYASLGNEYASGTLLGAINGVPGKPAHQQAFQLITQRLNEIQPGFQQPQLEQLLKSQALVPNTTAYVLYPVYEHKDNTDPQIKIAAISQVNEGWFNPSATPDGAPKSLGIEMLQDAPNSSWGQVIGKWQLQSHQVTVNGQVMWTPGTGYNQCLGMLSLNRTANVNFKGECPR
jgi:hypothetical protein